MKKWFRVHKSAKDADRTILDNANQAGNNCLTYMETVQGVTSAFKIYNKLVQTVESKSVREIVGLHMKDRVCQKDTRI